MRIITSIFSSSLRIRSSLFIVFIIQYCNTATIAVFKPRHLLLPLLSYFSGFTQSHIVRRSPFHFHAPSIMDSLHGHVMGDQFCSLSESSSTDQSSCVLDSSGDIPPEDWAHARALIEKYPPQIILWMVREVLSSRLISFYNSRIARLTLRQKIQQFPLRPPLIDLPPPRT